MSQGGDAKIRILNSDDLFAIMREILTREEKIDQDREHFWVIGLGNSNRLLFIELISVGTVNIKDSLEFSTDYY